MDTAPSIYQTGLDSYFFLRQTLSAMTAPTGSRISGSIYKAVNHLTYGLYGPLIRHQAGVEDYMVEAQVVYISLKKAGSHCGTLSFSSSDHAHCLSSGYLVVVNEKRDTAFIVRHQ